MKIGILTLPLHINYGGILQAWALQTVLERMGHEARLIVVRKPVKKPNVLKRLALKIYCPTRRWAAYAYRFIRNFFRKHKTEVRIEYNRSRMIYYTNRFINSYVKKYQIPCISAENVKDLDAIVVGSDQIWRKEYLNLFGISSPTTFLDFTANLNIKRIAYAASFGVDYWQFTDEETNVMCKAIQRFNAVSVREDSGVQLCKEYLGIEAKHVVDPTLLLDKEDYMQLVSNMPVKPSDGQLMTYVLDRTTEKDVFIQKVATERGLKVFKTNNPKIEDSTAPYSERQQPPIEQWLQGFNDAKFVITDSFHACVFSIIFDKPFIAIGNAERGMARFQSLLRMFGLEKNLIINFSDYNSKFSYAIPSTAQERLRKLRAEGLTFLKEALSK
jgi:polysaccharide pyruvyl transferase WcaK-like protein